MEAGYTIPHIYPPPPDVIPPRMYRKVICIRAEDSPNVRLALEEKARKRKPSHRILIPGVLPYADYKKRRETWDIVRQTIGLDGQFYEGAEVLLYPPVWLDRAHRIAAELHRLVIAGELRRRAKAIGIDTAEGGDSTAYSIVDEYGLIEVISKKTPDTSVVADETLALIDRYNMHESLYRVVFDAGGGGKVHADYLRARGYAVSTVAFGGAPTEPLRSGKRQLRERIEEREERFTYLNRRAEMYGELRILLEPIEGVTGFGIPVEYTNLRSELAPIPLLYDREGKLRLPPKRKQPNSQNAEKSLEELIGHSPDEADSFVLAVFGMRMKPRRRRAGAPKVDTTYR